MHIDKQTHGHLHLYIEAPSELKNKKIIILSVRRERPGANVLADGENDADAFLAQGEMEMKKGSDEKKMLYYLDKAVELNDYDETAYVARSKCYHNLGKNKEAIEDAEMAVERTSWSGESSVFNIVE